jgi:hypothetical protein
MAVRASEPHASCIEVCRCVEIANPLNYILAIAAVAQLGVIFECVEADAAGPFTTTMPPKGAAPPGAQELVLAEIGEFDSMPGLAAAGAAIIPSTVPAAHIGPPVFSKSIG